MSYKNYFKPMAESVKNFILRRKIIEKPIYVTKSPDVHTLRELGKFMDRKKALENVDLKKKLLKAQSELEQRDREKERMLEEQAIVEKVRKQREQMQKLEESKALKLKFLGMRDYPTIFSKSNIPLGRVQGLYLKETKDGRLMFYPWLESKKKESLQIIKEPVQNFNDIFKSELGMVSQMRGGKIDSNYDIDKDGQLVHISPNPIVEEKYKIVNISDQERAEYERQIEYMKNVAGEYAHKIKEMKQREVEFEYQLSDNEVLMTAATKERDLYASQYALLIKKQEGMYQQMLSAISELDDVKTKSLLAERLARSMESALENYRVKYEEAVSKEISDIEREKIVELQRESVSNMERIVGQAKEMMPKIQRVVKAPADMAMPEE